ncbi:unnamed protein product, partial [Sphacelaria rigidula]
VFRPREKERYKLRKHRKNDLDSFRKLQQVKKDFEKVGTRTRVCAERSSRKKNARKDRRSGSSRDSSGDGGGSSSRAAAAAAAAAAADGASAEAAEGDEARGDGAGDDPLAGTVGGLIPGSNISILPSFMDELKTRASIPVRSVVEPALPVYCVRAGSRRGVRRGGGAGRAGMAGRGDWRKGKDGSGGGRKRELSGVGVEPMYKFRLRGRIGRGGRVIWDRVPVEAAPPARDDGLADPDDAPHFVHSNYVQFPVKAPSACSLHPPMVNLH